MGVCSCLRTAVNYLWRRLRRINGEPPVAIEIEPPVAIEIEPPVAIEIEPARQAINPESPLDAQKCTIEWDHGDHQKVGDFAVITVKVRSNLWWIIYSFLIILCS